MPRREKQLMSIPGAYDSIHSKVQYGGKRLMKLPQYGGTKRVAGYLGYRNVKPLLSLPGQRK